MPIRPENKIRYPKNWPEISLRRRIDVGWRCEGRPDFPECRAENGKPHPDTGSIVVLTVAHLDHCPENSDDDENLRVWCQRCHLTYDANHHASTRARTAHEKAETREMFDDGA